jgi:hypothetical protein
VPDRHPRRRAALNNVVRAAQIEVQIRLGVVSSDPMEVSMSRPTLLRLAALIGAALSVAACGTLQWRASSTMARPATAALGSSEVDTPTQHHDAQRTGANLQETALTPSSVASGRFERLFDWQVDGQLYAQPLYLSQVPFPDGSKRNVVIAATTRNSVYAFEAPAADSELPPAKAVLWHLDSGQLGRPLPYDFFLIDWGVLGHNLKPQIGITSTPVVDRARGLVYVSVKTGFGKPWSWLFPPHHRLFAIHLVTGAIVAHATIDAIDPGHGGEATRFDPTRQLQRASLLESNDRIYLAFASHQDTPPYHGWVLAYDAQTLAPAGSYCTTCDFAGSNDCVGESCGGGIWQAGAGPVADRQGNVYVMTGNGDVDDRTTDRGNSFIKLDRDLKFGGSWTPANYECLNGMDADLGSAGPTWLDGPSVLVGGGKQGVLYALSAEALQGSQVQPGREGLQEPCDESDPVPVPNAAPGKPKYWSIEASRKWEKVDMNLLRLIDPSSQMLGFHHIHGAPVQWKVNTRKGQRQLLYVSAERDELRAYEFDNGFLKGADPGRDPVDTFHSPCRNSELGMPGGFLTISADDGNPETGIVWATMPRRNEDALNDTVPGVLRAYRAFPDDGRTLKEIWNSDTGTRVPLPPDCTDPASPGPNALGDHAKFAPPTVADGKVYVGTFSNRLVVYGLKQAAPAPAAKVEWDLSRLPASAEPGSAIAVSITATNQGDAAWRVADHVRIGSPTASQEKVAPTEGDSAARLAQDVPPGGSITFTFHLAAPAQEGSHHVTWQLQRNADPAQPQSGQWFGTPSGEWTFYTLKAGCAGLRQQASDVVARLKTDPSVAQSEKAAIKALLDQAADAGCSLQVGADAAMKMN